MPKKKTDMPSTLERSSKGAQRTWKKTHDSAVETYGEGEAAHRTAYASLKHSYEKKGDHWVKKDHKGPSDPQAKGGRDTNRETFGGVDVEGSTKQELVDRAKKAGVKGYSRMDKRELGRALAKKGA